MNTKPLCFADINFVRSTPSSSAVYTIRYMFRLNRAITRLYIKYKTLINFYTFI